MTADQSAEQPKKSAITVSRIILVLILIAAVAALLFDFMAKQSMNAAYERLNKANDEAECGPNLEGLSRDAVQQEVGREPDDETTEGTVTTQQYDFQGVFYIHRLEVEYNGDTMRGYKQESVVRFGFGGQ